jgi:formylglycine-generating enzyme required for sulfatase activity
LIPLGRFKMGSGISPEEVVRRYGGMPKWFGNEHPQHEATISHPFYLQTTGVTRGQWQKVMGGNPSIYKDCGDDCPVESVSGDDA